MAALEELVDALHLDRFVLAGDSTMCTAAVEVAARHPDRVAALALVTRGVVHEESETTRRFVANHERDHLGHAAYERNSPSSPREPKGGLVPSVVGSTEMTATFAGACEEGAGLKTKPIRLRAWPDS